MIVSVYKLFIQADSYLSFIQAISSFFVFNKPLEIPSYIPLFSQRSTATVISVVLKINMLHYFTEIIGKGLLVGISDLRFQARFQ